MLVRNLIRLRQRFPDKIGIATMASQETYNLRFNNPIDELQEYLEVPIFQKDDCPFNPSRDEMVAAEKIFRSTDVHKIKFLASAVNPEDFIPHDLPEVTFIGRSNVGKSSLLRAIFSEVKELHVKISKVPGHTKTINFYGVGNVMCLVDVPGYGYAQPKHFVESVETYLKTRKNLRRTFLLLDGKIGFQSFDEIAIEMLEEFKVPYCVVMTKIDKASLSRRMKNIISLQQIQNKFMSNRCYPQPFLVSSMTGEGIAYLQTFLTYLVGDVKINERFQLKTVV